MPTDPSPTARTFVRQLLAREIAGAEQPDAVSAAIQRLCTRLSENLRRSLGDDGRDALLERAFARTQPTHPALTEIGHFGKTGACFDGVAASVDAHGVSVVTAAVESLLATLAHILGGLIGADMVMNLLDHEDQNSKSPDGRQAQ